MTYEAEMDEQEINKELGISNDEIDDALSLIEKNEIVEKKEEVPAVQEEISIDDITRLAVDSYRDVQRHSEEIYDALLNPATRNVEQL
jgi:DNA-directed RNA polymerase specialized sigma subunit